MIVRIRRDPNIFDKYQHNKELVALVNLFADTTQELPNGWDTKKDKNSKVKSDMCVCFKLLTHAFTNSNSSLIILTKEPHTWIQEFLQNLLLVEESLMKA